MIKVILANHIDKTKEFDFDIEVYDNQLAQDWLKALKTDVIDAKRKFHHQFCFLGFANTYRDHDYLCNIVNNAISEINDSLDYHIPETYSKDMLNQDSLNTLHNHFEILKGKRWEPSEYFTNASKKNKENIELLNWTCHELETLNFATETVLQDPNNLRPATMMHWVDCPPHDLTDEHRKLFTNWYDSRFGEVYMHWCQIGKTLFEVFHDEGAPDLTDTICEAITELRYYSGEFDIHWGRDMTRANNPYWNNVYNGFNEWLYRNGIDPHDPKNSLGTMPIAQVQIEKSFGNTELQTVWDTLSDHMYVKGVEIE